MLLKLSRSSSSRARCWSSWRLVVSGPKPDLRLQAEGPTTGTAEEALKGTDKDVITSKTEALATAAQKLGEKMYAAEAAKAQAAGAASGTGAGPEASAKKEDGNVVDAEYEEVKDKK